MKERSKLRRMAGLTQIQLGRMVGKSATTICLWERGECELSSAEVEQIARAIQRELAKQPSVSSASQIARILGEP